MHADNARTPKERSIQRARVLHTFLAWAAIAGVIALLGGALEAPATPVSAATMVLSPVRDNTLYEDATGSTSNGAGSYIFSGRTNGGFLRRALVAFDVAASVPPGATITSATLKLTLSRTTAPAENIEAHRALAAWGEGTSDATSNEGMGAPAATGDVTWLFRSYNTVPWAAAGGDFSAAASATTLVAGMGTYGWTSPELVADVQSWVDNPSSNDGWVVTGAEATAHTTKRFNSKEHAMVASRPVLEIEFTAANTATPTATSDPGTPTATPDAFATPLHLPPVLTDPNIDISIEQACVQILPGPCTQMWTYDGTYPGPTIRRPTGETTNVTYTNNLPEAAGEMTVHNHGNHSSSESDGSPHDNLIQPKESRTYTYDGLEDGGNERGTTQFYHDHRMDVTGRNTWMGLTGFYIIDDPAEPASLPHGAFDIPLMIADRQFDASNQTPYTFDLNGVTGSTILVDGVHQPHLDVGDRKYRFRILNASNARVYDFTLSTGQPFTQIGTESGLFPSPIDRTDMRAGPAERLDVVVNFAGHLGEQLYLRDTRTGLDILQFRVTQEATDDSAIPPALRPLPVLGTSSVIRTFDFGQTAGRWTINRKVFDPARIDAQPVLGATETWVLHNAGSATHTIHLHDVDQQCVSRDGGPCLPYESLKETWFLGANETVEIKLKFTDHTGEFVFHCHVLEHEDSGMMALFEVVAPPAADASGPGAHHASTQTATTTGAATLTPTPQSGAISFATPGNAGGAAGNIRLPDTGGGGSGGADGGVLTLAIVAATLVASSILVTVRGRRR